MNSCLPINLKKVILPLTELSYIDEIWLHGSRARQDCTDRSDIDIAILAPRATPSEWHSILQHIDTIKTLLNIDYVRFDTLTTNDPLYHNIINNHIVLFKKVGNYMDKILWQDSFIALGNALNRLQEIILEPNIKNNQMLQDGAIQRFEFCTELFWKTLKKCLAYEKIIATSPKDVLQKAYQFNLIDHEDIWLAMLDDRNITSHVYKQEDAYQVFQHIQQYAPILTNTYAKLKLKYFPH